MKTELLDYLQNASLEELEAPMAVISDHLYNHRLEHNGLVPYPLYHHCLAIGGQYACLEIILVLTDKEGRHLGYPLRRRGAGEHGWTGQYHVAGAGLRLVDRPVDIRYRVLQEWFGSNYPVISWEEMICLGSAIYDADEYRVACMPSVWVLEINSLEKLVADGRWRLFELDEVDDEIITPFHRRMLRWVTGLLTPEGRLPKNLRQEIRDLR